MVALCAAAHPHPLTAQRACRDGLGAQALYGGHIEIRDIGWCSLGITSQDRASRMASDGPLTILADCRLHDCDALIEALGDSRRAPSDAALILGLWAQSGRDIVPRLSGSFAFIVADARKRTLTLVRDLAGTRSLCFVRDGELTIAASMPSGVGLGSGEPDIDYMVSRLAGRRWFGDEIQWRRVRNVAPGTIVTIGPDAIHVERHFCPTAIERRAWHPDLADELRTNLDRAVGCALEGAGAVVATHLSSGLDSSAVATSAAQAPRRPQRLIAFTAAPAEIDRQLVGKSWIGDESAIAAQTARLAGIDHTVVRDTTRIADSIRGMARYFQDSSPNPFNHGWWTAINRQAHAQGAKVLLTAFFGNTTISFGGLTALADHLAQGRPLRWASEAWRSRRANDVTAAGVLFASLAPWTPLAVENALRRRWQQSPPFEAASFVNRDVLRRIEQRSAPLRPRCADVRQERANVLWMNDVGFRNLGIEALTGIEEREPLVDRRLVEFTFALPTEALIDRGTVKPLLKTALRGRVPESVLAQHRRGLQGADWFARIDQAEARTLAEEISASRWARELIDLDRLIAAIDDWPLFDPTQVGSLTAFGRHVTNALADGLFLAEAERYPVGV